MYSKIGEFVETLIIITAISIPFAMWKIIELIFLAIKHIKITIE